MECGGQVDCDDCVPLSDRKILDWRDMLDAALLTSTSTQPNVFSASEIMLAISIGSAMFAGE
jgi:hypothetical protein